MIPLHRWSRFAPSGKGEDSNVRFVYAQSSANDFFRFRKTKKAGVRLEWSFACLILKSSQLLVIYLLFLRLKQITRREGYFMMIIQLCYSNWFLSSSARYETED